MRQIYAHTLATPYAQQSRARSGSLWVLMTVCLAVLLAQVDTSVVNQALRSIRFGLHTTVTGLQWVLVPAARSGSAASLINVARMIGAALGVAILGTAFALAGAGGAGLRAAMLPGGAVQIVGGAVAWRALR